MVAVVGAVQGVVEDAYEVVVLAVGHHGAFAQSSISCSFPTSLTLARVIVSTTSIVPPQGAQRITQFAYLCSNSVIACGQRVSEASRSPRLDQHGAWPPARISEEAPQQESGGSL